MNQPRLQVAGIAKVHGSKFFTALIQREKLEVRGCMVQPGHPLGCGSPGSSRHDHLEPAKVAATIALLPTVVQPENPQRQNAVHNRRRLCFAHADHRFGGGPFEKPPAHVGWAEAVLQIHC